MLNLFRSGYFRLVHFMSGCHVSPVYFRLSQIKSDYVRIRKVISVISDYVK
jgi:hypothetical protein